jgi:hypothetical protein
LKKKLFVTFQICMYTMAVYMGSSIYTPSIPGVMVRFGVGPQLASMGLSMYVLAYGLGPMLFSPLSELPLIGRNPPYMITFAIFVILLVPTALVDNFPGLIVRILSYEYIYIYIYIITKYLLGSSLPGWLFRISMLSHRRRQSSRHV